MVALGAAVTVMDAVVWNKAQPPAAAIV